MASQISIDRQDVLLAIDLKADFTPGATPAVDVGGRSVNRARSTQAGG